MSAGAGAAECLTESAKQFLIEQMRKPANLCSCTFCVQCPHCTLACHGLIWKQVTDGYGGDPARYSVEDLDRMRKAILRNPQYGARTHFNSRFLEDIREGREARAAAVEDILRTHMLNGTTPADLEKAADLEWQLIKERREARRAAAAAEASEVLGAFAKQKAVDDTANEIISAVTLPITDLNRSKIKTTLWGLLARFT